MHKTKLIRSDATGKYVELFGLQCGLFIILYLVRAPVSAQPHVPCVSTAFAPAFLYRGAESAKKMMRK